MLNLSDNLLTWYKKNKRSFPWRRKEDLNNPYFIWLSEIMLQQTTTQTVKNYYKKFTKKWPNVHSLSKAKLNEILLMWQGLGYYNRANNLHRSSKIISKKYDGTFPSSKKDLLNLPGIGEYTANAIRAIAFNQKSIGIDTNISRVVSRIFNIQESNKEKINQAAEEILPKKNFGNFMQAMIDLGATICTKKKINCTECPISRNCNYNGSMNMQTTSKKKMRKFVYFYLILKKDKFFLKRRKNSKLLNNLMEFPGTELLDKKLEMNDLRKMAPVKSRWILSKKIINYKISNYNLKIKILITNLKKNIDLKNGVWITKKGMRKVPTSTLIKKVFNSLESINQI